ncbi:MAG: radical SAM protein [Desulfobulbales bacterium]
MKIALIIPRNSSDSNGSFYDYNFYSTFLLSKKYLSYLLAIPTLTALTPAEHEIRIFDENIEDIDFNWAPDLAGITVRTMFANRAYEIAEEFGRFGIKTVLGGIHPSMCPDEALQHCDSVVIGEAEGVWLDVLRDAENGSLKRTYKKEAFADLKKTPIAVRKAISINRYFSDVIQTTKGCPFSCEFCSVHAFDGQRIRSRSVEQVVLEIKEINNSPSTYKKKKAIFFADDNIIANKSFARELFIALKDCNINWMCQASINISQEDELLALMRASGCGAIFIGFESLSQENLSSMNKGVNKKFEFGSAIMKIQSHGILVHSSFIVGYDDDSPESFDELIHFIQENNLLVPLLNILTPFPGTKLFKRFEKEKRILHKDWDKYDTKHVVFSPAGMSIEELLLGYKRILREVYSFDSILKKLNHYWKIDFWKQSNRLDPVRLRYRILFALRLCSLMASGNLRRSWFIIRILPRVFNRRVRISTLLTLMAYNDFAYSL